ncbi:ABC transporter permease [Mucilaginibacter ginsenosidivorax]|uniref:ABC transporter permease n=1 Tax=Mucilaginibacter ginsenosidivorax TaxID=862126 RepID=A0A5B8VYP5_9SPHI|nr:ABC transporter permease [Mucilaginibacter ginsenosidivorax]QEC76687.1 ABC transporter permease [Mucilaginibacter ginsenosidivorax]
MKTALLLNIALALLMARLKQSIVAAAGVTFGIAMFIALISFMTGLNKMLDSLIINRTPHIRLYNAIAPSKTQPINRAAEFTGFRNFILSVKPKDEGKQIYNANSIIKTIRADERVVDVAPKTSTTVFFNSGTIQLSGVIDGVDVDLEQKLFNLNDNIIEGTISNLNTVSNSIIIGKGLADKLIVKIGDVIQVTTPDGDRAMLKIVGIVQFGIAEVDDVQSFTSIQTAQKLQGKPANYITDIQVKLKDIALAPAVAREYARLFDVSATDVQTANAQFETGTTVRNTIAYSVSVTLLIVAGFGIYNILNMLIYEKMDAIAILKATGFSGSDVKAIFIQLSMVLGVVGGIIGLILGYCLSVIISHIPFETSALPTIKTYPVNFGLIYYLIGISFALVTTYFAGLFPARKAAKIDPVAIIRGK